MKKIAYILFGYLISFELLFAAEGEKAGGVLGELEKDDVRKGDIHIDDIPKVLRGAIDLLLEIAGTVAIIFIIIGAYKILFGSLTSDKTKGKDTIIMALVGFAIASLAWFIIKFLIDNLA